MRSYTLLNHESPEFIRFVNPGDFRIAHISCGTAGCHPKEVQTNRKQIMSTGCMLWGAALYNNGTVPIKRAALGEAYGMNGGTAAAQDVPAADRGGDEKKGVVPYLDPLPRFEMSPAGQHPPHLRAGRPVLPGDRHPGADGRTGPARARA